MRSFCQIVTVAVGRREECEADRITVWLERELLCGAMPGHLARMFAWHETAYDPVVDFERCMAIAALVQLSVLVHTVGATYILGCRTADEKACAIRVCQLVRSADSLSVLSSHASMRVTSPARSLLRVLAHCTECASLLVTKWVQSDNLFLLFGAVRLIDIQVHCIRIASAVQVRSQLVPVSVLEAALCSMKEHCMSAEQQIAVFMCSVLLTEKPTAFLDNDVYASLFKTHYGNYALHIQTAFSTRYGILSACVSPIAAAADITQIVQSDPFRAIDVMASYSSLV